MVSCALSATVAAMRTRTTELEQTLSLATTDELEVRNENRTPTDTASEILGRIGWI